MNMLQDKNTEKFISEVEKRFPNVYDFSETVFVSSKSPVTLICKLHGKFVLNNASNILDNRTYSSCEGCSNEIRIKKNLDKFKIRLSEKHGDKFTFNYASFININTEIEFFCVHHDKSFLKTPSQLLSSKHGCPDCLGDSYTELYRTIRNKSWGTAKDFLTNFFSENHYFPPWSYLKDQNKSFHSVVKNTDIYEKLCEEITVDFRLYMNSLYDINGNKVGSMYELILNNTAILHNILYDFQVKFDQSQRTCDYKFYPKTSEKGLMVEIAGRHGIRDYTEKLNKKIKIYENIGFSYYEINPCEKGSSNNYEDFFQNHIKPFYKNFYPEINLFDSVIPYLKGSNILNSIEESVMKIDKKNLYDRYIRTNFNDLHNKIISVFKNYTNFQNYFRISQDLTNGNVSPSTWENPENIASVINEFITKNGYFPKTKDIPFSRCNYHGYGIDDFRVGGKFNHLISWDGTYNYNNLPLGFKFPNNYWTLYRAIEFGVLNIQNNEYPRGFRKLKYGQSANTVILSNGGMFELSPGRKHWGMVSEILEKYGFEPNSVIFNLKKPNGFWQDKTNVKKELNRIATILGKDVIKLNSQDLKNSNSGLGKQILNFSNYKEFIKWSLT